MYIVIEGGEGSGKTTTIESLKKLYPNVVFVSEPGGTPLGKELKRQIFKQKYADITDVYLFAAARAELFSTIIIPALKEGKVVVSDRSVVSSMVYQGLVGGIGIDTVKEANACALQGVIPDKIVYFRTSYETSCARTGKRSDDGGESNYYDTAGQDFFQSVDQAYMSMSTTDNFIIIDADKENEDRIQDMVKIIES